MRSFSKIAPTLDGFALFLVQIYFKRTRLNTRALSVSTSKTMATTNSCDWVMEASCWSDFTQNAPPPNSSTHYPPSTPVEFVLRALRSQRISITMGVLTFGSDANCQSG
jgi:hypothetical protein